jgi:transcription elongation factor GreA
MQVGRAALFDEHKTGGRLPMTARTEQAWMTQDAHDRLNRELVSLLAQRDNGAGEDAGVTEQEQRDRRIRQLRDLLGSAVVHEPPDDGVAEPGMVITVRFEGEDETETFLMADREGAATAEGFEVCSPKSPLGRALTGAVPGEQREYLTPGGSTRVMLIMAVPHRGTG